MFFAASGGEFNPKRLKKLAENSLANREMREIKGGAVCGCGCCYAGTGGSSSTDNGNANFSSGSYSPGCDNDWIVKP